MRAVEEEQTDSGILLKGPGECPNFERLVLGCIDVSDSESRRIFQNFSRSTIFAYFCTAQSY